MQRGLGTQLRHLSELLDGAVAEAYDREGLSFRPRYFPVFRALMERGPLSVTEVASIAGITQPAATQTISLMVREGLLVSNRSRTDSRQKVIDLSAHSRDLLPRLQQCWDAVLTATAALDAELPYRLPQLLELAIEALNRRPFQERIQAARKQQSTRSRKRTTPPTMQRTRK